MENINEQNLIKSELIEEENQVELRINKCHLEPPDTSTTTSINNSILSTGINLTPTLDNVREKRIRKQKNYDDDYVLFNTNSKHRQSHNYQNEYLKSEMINNDNFINNGDFDANSSSFSQSLISNSNMPTTSTNEMKFNVGDLVWAKVSGHPWWPCMISTDAAENSHIKLVGSTRPKRMFYVEFFGPSVEHAWVTEGCLIEYKGIEAFKTYAQDQVDQAPTKSQKEKLAERFQLKVALTRRDQWERAVEEADDAIKKRVTDRKQIFTHKLTNVGGARNRRNTMSNDDNNLNNSENEETTTVLSKKITKVKRDSTSSVTTTDEFNNNMNTTFNNNNNLTHIKSRNSSPATNNNKKHKRKRLSSIANSDDRDTNSVSSMKLKKIDSNELKNEYNAAFGSSNENLDSVSDELSDTLPLETSLNQRINKFDNTSRHSNLSSSSLSSCGSLYSLSDADVDSSSLSSYPTSKSKRATKSSSLLSFDQFDEYVNKKEAQSSKIVDNVVSNEYSSGFLSKEKRTYDHMKELVTVESLNNEIVDQIEISNENNEIIHKSNHILNDDNFLNSYDQEVDDENIENRNQSQLQAALYQNICDVETISNENIDDLLNQAKFVTETIDKNSTQAMTRSNYNSSHINVNDNAHMDYMMQNEQEKQYEPDELDKSYNNEVEFQQNELVTSIPTQKKRGRKPKLLKNQLLIDQNNNNETYTTATILRGTKRYITVKKQQQSSCLDSFNNENDHLEYMQNFDTYEGNFEHQKSQHQKIESNQLMNSTYIADIKVSENKNKSKAINNSMIQTKSHTQMRLPNNLPVQNNQEHNYKILNKIDLNNITNNESENYYDYTHIENYTNHDFFNEENDCENNEDDEDDIYYSHLAMTSSNNNDNNSTDDSDDTSDENYSDVEKINRKKQKSKSSSSVSKSKRKKRTKSNTSDCSIDLNQINLSNLQFNRKQYSNSNNNSNNNTNNLLNKKSSSGTAETYLIDRYKYAVRHIKQGLSVDEACNKYRISKGALLKCLSGGTAPRGKKTRLTENEENTIVEWLISNQNLKYNEAIHLVFQEVVNIFQKANRPNPFHNGKPSMDWWYDFLSRHPQIMASKPEWLRRGKVNDQYILDVQSGKLKCTKFRRALLSAIQYIRSLNDSNAINLKNDNSNSHSQHNGHSNDNMPINTNKNSSGKLNDQNNHSNYTSHTFNVAGSNSSKNQTEYLNNSPKGIGGNSIDSRIIRTIQPSSTSKQINKPNKKPKKKLRNIQEQQRNQLNQLKVFCVGFNKLNQESTKNRKSINNNFNKSIKVIPEITHTDYGGAARINLIKNKDENEYQNTPINNQIGGIKTVDCNKSNLENSYKSRNYNSLNENIEEEYDETIRNHNGYSSISYNQNNFIDSILSTNNSNLVAPLIQPIVPSQLNVNENQTDIDNRRLILKFKLGQQNQHLLLSDDDDNDDDDINNLKDSIDPSAFCPDN